MPKWCPAKITRKHIWTEGLFTLHVECPGLKPFVPGQFLQLAMMDGDKRINRPYSVASPHGTTVEFFIVKVDDGELTPRLWALDAGDEVEVSERPRGVLRLKKRQTQIRCGWLEPEPDSHLTLRCFELRSPGIVTNGLCWSMEFDLLRILPIPKKCKNLWTKRLAGFHLFKR